MPRHKPCIQQEKPHVAYQQDRTGEPDCRYQAVAESKLSPKETQQLAGFFPIYFEETEHADLRQFSSLDLFGAALAHFEFARKRSAGQHKVRIYTPDFERDGWQSTHSVIEVVNDDMPFLIDSISMLLSRYNINLHLLVHPVLSVGRDKNGNLQEVKRTQDRSLPLESFIHVQIDRVSDAATLQKLEAELNRIIADIRLVVSDEPKMRAVVGDIGKDLAKVKGERAVKPRKPWISSAGWPPITSCSWAIAITTW
jgi:glutamate dehydrogenase